MRELRGCSEEKCARGAALGIAACVQAVGVSSVKKLGVMEFIKDVAL